MREKGENKRAFSFEDSLVRISGHGGAGQNGGTAQKRSREFEIFPINLSVRKRWFSLSIREREVVALVCMGYGNNEIAAMLGVGYGTIQTHIQNIFRKFGLHSRGELRTALESWPAEEWWHVHH